MSDHLWRCKNFRDYLTVRDNLVKGAYTFKGRQTMISRGDKDRLTASERDMKADKAMRVSQREATNKLGGFNRQKRYGGRP